MSSALAGSGMVMALGLSRRGLEYFLGQLQNFDIRLGRLTEQLLLGGARAAALAAGVWAAGAASGASSEMILRMEARISSMVGSC